MPRFSANLSTLFQDLPLIERFPAAAAAGFKAVELWFPYEVPAQDMARVLKANGLVCVGINSPLGNIDEGDLGLAVDPTRRNEFLKGVEQAMEYAHGIDCANVHVMAGVRAVGMQVDDAWKVYMDNIGVACDVAVQYGRHVMIEPLNAIDRPTYLLSRQAQAVEVLKALNRDNLGIMVDLFHLQRGEENLIEHMRMSLPYATHVQIVDVPGRHEPGTGEINFAMVLKELDKAGYTGWVRCEYFPSKSTVEGLDWMAKHGIERP